MLSQLAGPINAYSDNRIAKQADKRQVEGFRRESDTEKYSYKWPERVETRLERRDSTAAEYRQ